MNSEELKLHELKKIVDMFHDYSCMRELRNAESSVKINSIGIDNEHDIIFFFNKRIGFINFNLTSFKNAFNKLGETMTELGVEK